MGTLTGKNVLIIGMASKRSIAYGVAKAMHDQGANLAFTYQNERLQERVTNLASDFNATTVLPLDVTQDDQIEAVFASLKNTMGHLDTLVHSVAFAPSDQLEGSFVDSVTREGFALSHDISSYSLAALAQSAKRHDLLKPGSNLVTMSYIGSERAIPCYNTMGIAKASLEATVRYLAQSMGPDGIRVNAISAGPIRTLAASGIKHFKAMLDYSEKVTPLKRNVTIEEVGQSAAFLASDAASGITGHILYVDGGFHAVGMGEV